jgi:hypothetical protein
MPIGIRVVYLKRPAQCTGLWRSEAGWGQGIARLSLGAAMARYKQIANTGNDQKTRSDFQSPFTAGMTSVSVVATGKIQPTIKPLE